MADRDGPPPDGIFSLLDTDLYKLTMQCAILKHFPKVEVTFAFTNRTPHMKLSRAAFKWLQDQIQKLGNIQVSSEEVEWLRKTCPFLNAEYLSYLEGFRLRPSEHVVLTFDAGEGDDNDETSGDLSIETKGLWLETILYEIPLLALVSEAYFKFVDRDWTHERQVENAKSKGVRLLEDGCIFSEFGSRRRRDYKTHEMIIQGLVDASKEAQSNGKNWKGKFSGTSNVHFAMRFGIQPIGTVAHEWFMAIAAITDDYANANELAMQYWVNTYGRGVLAIALTDTFGTPAFLRAFTKPSPGDSKSKENLSSDSSEPSYAETWTGVRQDSGDPLEYLKLMKSFYSSQKITTPKVMVYSDSLNVDKCMQYRAATEEVGLSPSFGVGTFFTNDFKRHSKLDEKSVPLNIVIKLSSAAGRPAVKLSDNVGKNTGDEELVKRVKGIVGYEERGWKDVDEAHRWDSNRA